MSPVEQTQPALLIREATSGLTRYNPPGQAALAYRGGSFTAALQRMLIRLPLQKVEDGASGTPATPLDHVNVVAHDDWTIGLVHAWAAVTDVLTFYQERIVNEGYLRTATERLSVVELARAIGYELRPGLAASTLLAFAVETVPGQPAKQVKLPSSLAVQSVPGVGDTVIQPLSSDPLTAPATSELPQTFETGLDFVARSEWNLLRPVRLSRQTWAYDIRSTVTSLRLAGLRSDLQPGATVLMLGEPKPGGGGRRWQLVQLVAVEPDLARDWTVIRWDASPRAEGGGTGPLTNPRVLAMRREVGLYGYAPSSIAYRANAQSHWQPLGIGLPAAAVQALARTAQGYLVAATEKDIFRSLDQGETWQPATTGLVEKSVTTLTADGEGHLWAGTDAGDVFLSKDEGDNWQAPGGVSLRLPVRGLRKLIPALFRSRDDLPETVVHALVAYRQGRKAKLAAATDNGVFISTDEGRAWKGANLNLPTLDGKTGEAKDPVRALATARHGSRVRLYAGSDSGVFPIRQTPSLGGLALLSFLLAIVYQLYTNSTTLLADVALRWANRLLDLAKGIPAIVNGIVTGLFNAIDAATRSFFDVGDVLQQAENAVTGAVTGLFKPVANLTLPTQVVCPDPIPDGLQCVDLSKLPSPLNRVGPSLLNSPVGQLAIDTAFLFLVLGALVAAAWLLRRALYNRPANRIRDPRTAGTPGRLGRAAAKVPLVGAWLAQRLPKDYPAVPITALAAGSNGQLFAGTAAGIYRANDLTPQGNRLRRLVGGLRRRFLPELGRRWDLVNDALDVSTLSFAADGAVLAGSAEGGLWRSPDNGETWTAHAEDLNLAGLQALTVAGDGLIAAGAPADAKVDPHWSPFQLHDGQLHLDGVYGELQAGGWAVLLPGRPSGQADGSGHAPVPRLLQIERADTLDSQAFDQPGRLTGLTVAADPGLEAFDRTTATVIAGSQPLPLVDDRPVMGSRIKLDRFVPGLKPGHRLIVSGKRLRVRLTEAAGQPYLMTADGRRAFEMNAGQSYLLLAPPPGWFRPAEDAPAYVKPQIKRLKRVSDWLASGKEPAQAGFWHLRDRDYFEGLAALGSGTFALEPATVEDELVGEPVVVAAVGDSGGCTVVDLEQPLRSFFDRSSVTIYGNVVPASHGKTVSREVLGSSDGSIANQRFSLRQAPLTYVGDASAAGASAALEIAVSGVKWHQVPAFYGLSRDRRAFVVRHDERGVATVAFGDGKSGSRLPSNREEVTATYRIGLGPQGNLPAGSLTQLLTGSAGIASVTNPLPASGGVGPEPDDRARSTAPARLRGLGRIVSLTDYEDFAHNFAGIGKARVDLMRRGHQRHIHLTICDGEGLPIDRDSALYRNLAAAIDRWRPAPVPLVQIDSLDLIFFNVDALLTIDPDHSERRDAIVEIARRRLLARYAFAQRHLAQDVAAAELISLLQAVDGVVAVTLRRLFRYPWLEGDPVSPSLLEARPTRWEDGEIRPAQLLLINDRSWDGVRLETEIAR